MSGAWEIKNVLTVKGDGLQPAPRLDVSLARPEGSAVWTLSGVTSNERYVTREERSALQQRQEGLGRTGAICAALIPIKKSDEWWALSQDERRDVLETQSRHVEIGMRYLPAVARRLHHCRDLGCVQPFDFLTWFEFAPADERLFAELLESLRATPEWRYVDREVEVRLERVRCR